MQCKFTLDGVIEGVINVVIGNFLAQINVSATAKHLTNATILWCFGLMMVNVTHSIQEDHVKKVNARSECHLLRFLHNPKFVCRQAASDREGQIG